MCVGGRGMLTSQSVHVEIGGQLVEAGSLLPPLLVWDQSLLIRPDSKHLYHQPSSCPVCLFPVSNSRKIGYTLSSQTKIKTGP